MGSVVGQLKTQYSLPRLLARLRVGLDTDSIKQLTDALSFEVIKMRATSRCSVSHNSPYKFTIYDNVATIIEAPHKINLCEQEKT